MPPIRHAKPAGQPRLFMPCRAFAGGKRLTALGIAALLLAGSVHAAKITERTQQKHAAEVQRAALEKKLSALKHDIDRTESARSDAADALAQSEAAISKANRALVDLSRDQRRIEAMLTQLAQQQQQLGQAIATQQKQLAGLLRGQYVSGNEDRMKLLLSGDNPNRINRDLQYMGYVSRAQGRLIESLRANLRSVEDNKAETQNAKDELEQVAQEQQAQKARLQQQKTRHARLLSQLSSKLAAQRKQAGHIEHNQQRLSTLVDRLAHLIEEQRKAEAAARAKRRREQQEQLARAREKQRAAAAARTRAGKKTPSANPDAIDDDEPPQKSLARNELTPDADVQDRDFGQPFSTLRGQLRLPVRGDLIAKFGSKRGNGPSWKGLFIRTAEGAPVKAVAGGQVVFADWLRGFGNLIIIDHGSQYMTIYGNNQAVLKHAGDIVKTGDIIANAGNSGGNEQSGLYFEVRHQGRAIDPLEWVTIR